MDTREAITRLIFVSDAPQPVDIVMVLGCASITSMDPAIALYHNGQVARVLISGKGQSEACEPEWRVFMQYALNHGIPSSAMILETEARNTRENFAFSEAVVAREVGWSNVSKMALVTNPIHARRAKMTARRYFPPHVGLTMLCPSDERCIQAETWWKSKYGRQMVLDEIRRIGEYGLRGHLADF